MYIHIGAYTYSWPLTTAAHMRLNNSNGAVYTHRLI